MKVGQMISMVEFDGLPEEQHDELQAQARDAARRRPAGPVRAPREADAQGVRRAAGPDLLRFRRARVRRRLDRPGPSRDDPRRRRGRRQDPVSGGRGGGRDRPAQRDVAAAARQAAGAGARRQGDGRGAARADRRGARLRARGPEPAPDRAAAARPSRSSPCPASTPTCRPGASSSRSTSRVDASRRCGGRTRPSATATARSSSGSSSGCSIATGSPSGTRTRATTCCAPTAESASLTSAAPRRGRRAHRRRSGRSRSPSATRTQPALKAAMIAGGYLPANRADAVEAEFALRLMRRAIKWYAVPGERRFSPGHERRDRESRASGQRRAGGDQVAGQPVHGSARPRS